MRWWNLLNNALFDGKLITPRKIIVRGFRDSYGLCYPMKTRGDVKIGINSEFYDRKTFLMILAHEMVHQWQWTFDESITLENFDDQCHGKTFWQWKNILKRVFNIPLAEKY